MSPICHVSKSIFLPSDWKVINMTNSLTNQSNPLAYLIENLNPFFELSTNSQSSPKSLNSDKRTRARILPKQIRPSYIFAPEFLPWLKSCAINISLATERAKIITYTIPLLGITNRPLAGYKKAGLNLFKTFVKLTPKANLNNLDQCTIEFGMRLPMNARDFIEEIHRQIYLSTPRIKTKGRLTFYCHNSVSTPVTTDLETLRLSIIKTMPTINIDWLDPSLSWEALWNPCSQLEPIKLKLEDKLIIFLDQLIQQICASQCNAVMQRRHCFFDSTYLLHRKNQMLPELNKIVYTPNSDMQNNRILDLFKTEKNLFSYVNQTPRNQFYRSQSYASDSGWLPVNI